jgi:citrate-Mg2+:H+ or citrate-Ca2+:H+ symporter, CitMHS family
MVANSHLALVFTPDAYYFGVLPIVAQAGAAYGVDPAVMGRAAILGQMTTGFPLSPLTASTFILVGLSGVDLGDHQRFIFKRAFATHVDHDSGGDHHQRDSALACTGDTRTSTMRRS